MGSHDTLEDKTVTVCCGSDFVNVTFINFSCSRKDMAQVSLRTEEKAFKILPGK
jgi:phosphatidylinositol phospholipase C, beta